MRPRGLPSSWLIVTRTYGCDKIQPSRQREALAWMTAEELLPREPLPASFADLSDCRHGCNGLCLIASSERCDFTCHAGLSAGHPCEACGQPTMNWHEGWFCTEECVRDYLDELVVGWDWQWVVDDVLRWNQQRG